MDKEIKIKEDALAVRALEVKNRVDEIRKEVQKVVWQKYSKFAEEDKVTSNANPKDYSEYPPALLLKEVKKRNFEPVAMSFRQYFHEIANGDYGLIEVLVFKDKDEKELRFLSYVSENATYFRNLYEDQGKDNDLELVMDDDNEFIMAEFFAFSHFVDADLFFYEKETLYD